MSTLDSSPGATGEESLSPLEQEVLDEYVRLAGNLGDVSLLFSSHLQPRYHFAYHIEST
jgi:DASH complex subunit DAD3